MSLSPIVSEAVRRARAGDFGLLDCLELVDRYTEAKKESYASTPLLVARLGGHTLIGSGEVGESLGYDSWGDCAACGGSGELTARGDNGKRYEVECPECDGDGSIDSPIQWHDLNGVPAEFAPYLATNSGVVVRNLTDARVVIDKANGALTMSQQVAA